MSSPIESSELTCSPNITDYKISTCLMFTGAFIYILVAGFPALHKVEAHEAKAIQLSADLIFAIFSLISTFGLLHLSFFNGWYARIDMILVNICIEYVFMIFVGNIFSQTSW